MNIFGGWGGGGVCVVILSTRGTNMGGVPRTSGGVVLYEIQRRKSDHYGLDVQLGDLEAGTEGQHEGTRRQLAAFTAKS